MHRGRPKTRNPGVDELEPAGTDAVGVEPMWAIEENLRTPVEVAAPLVTGRSRREAAAAFLEAYLGGADNE